MKRWRILISIARSSYVDKLISYKLDGIGDGKSWLESERDRLSGAPGDFNLRLEVNSGKASLTFSSVLKSDVFWQQKQVDGQMYEVQRISA